VVRFFGTIGWFMVLSVSLLALPLTYNDGRAEEFPDLTHELVSLSSAGKPVLMFSTAGMLTDLVDLYAGDDLAGVRVVTLMDGERESWTGADRWLERGITIDQMDQGALASVLPEGDPESDAFWFIRRFGGSNVVPYFHELGYRRIGTIRLYRNNIELWARPGAVLGETIYRTGGEADASGWRFSNNVAPGWDPDTSGSTIELGQPESQAKLTLTGSQNVLYTVQSEIWTVGNGPWAGIGRMSLSCLSAAGDVLTRPTTRATSDDHNGAWTPAATAVLCPEGTTSIEVILSRAGNGPVAFKNIRIQRFQPSP
jgi:hypothetical protein